MLHHAHGIYPFATGKIPTCMRHEEPENARMILQPDELRRRIREAMDASKIDASELARLVNRKPDYFRDFLNGRKASIKSNELAKLDNIFGLKEGTLGGYQEHWQTDGSADSSILNTFYARTNFVGPELFIYPTRDSGDDWIEIDPKPFDIVERPWYIKDQIEGFAFLVYGDGMSPAFEPGDIAVVNTLLPPSRDRNVLITTTERTPEWRGVVRSLIGWSEDEWHVRRFKDRREERLPRRTWQKAFRIVSRLDG